MQSAKEGFEVQSLRNLVLLLGYQQLWGVELPLPNTS